MKLSTLHFLLLLPIFPLATACRDAGPLEEVLLPPVDTSQVADTTIVLDTLPSPRYLALDSTWSAIDSLWQKLPEWAAVYERPDKGAGFSAWAVVFDPSADSADWRVQTTPVLKPLGKFWADEPGSKLACINATFFGSPNQNFGLVIRDGQLLSPNVQQVTRTFQGTPTAYYPTRAAMGMEADGQLSAYWTYTPPGSDSAYAYPSPAPNLEGSPPLERPGAGFPQGAFHWKPAQAVGGSPMLLRNGAVQITAAEELITGSAVPSSSRPRSAMGFTEQGFVILLVVQAPNNKGSSLPVLAGLLKSMGATDAMNLDGGGSSGLMVAGTRLVSSSDGTDRPIVSAIFLKKKN
jgi:hypothetical protein